MSRVQGAYTTVRIGGPSGGHHRITYHPTGGRWLAGRGHTYVPRPPHGIARGTRRTHAGYSANKTAGRKRKVTYHASKAAARHAPAHYSPSRTVGIKAARPAHHSSGLNALESRRANMAKARAKEAHSARTAKQLAADLRNLELVRSPGAKHRGTVHPSSAASIAAARANLAKARAVAASRPRTAAQLAAARSSIKKAQAVARTLPHTAAQKAASRSNVAKARLVSARRPRTPAQIAAARRNIAKARAARSHRRR